MVSNDTMSVVSKSNKYETRQEKITNPLTIKKLVLVCSYFCTHISHLLNFHMDDVVLFDTKYFFIFYNLFTKDIIYSQKKSTKNNNRCRHLSNTFHVF